MRPKRGNQMESSLLDVLFLSEKRKNLLLLLLDGPKNIEEIKNTLDVRSSPIMTQIKILMKQDLVVESRQALQTFQYRRNSGSEDEDNSGNVQRFR